MDNGKKNTPKILTTDDIRKSARDWTLAGDVGLLAHLEQFSENILNKTQETQKNFNELADNYEELYTKVGNVTNQFLALQNCQFVENRVYDEETPTEEKPEVKVQDEAEQEKLLLMQYKEAVEIGVKLLDTHFQEVQLPPNSDSDEDDEISAGKSIMWKPKNPYMDKKFPLLIGSAEWWADDHVGLRANEDILDKIISESESDVESIKSAEKTMKSSSSASIENLKPVPSKRAFLESSDDLFGFDKNESVKNNAADGISKGSLLEKSAGFLPDFERETHDEGLNKWNDSLTENQSLEQPKENEKQSEGSSKPNKVDNMFTRELMAKLASVTNKKELAKEKVQEKSRGDTPPSVAVKSDENLFDETDDSCDLFSAKLSTAQEKTPETKGLFFDAENDDELFKGENDLFTGSGLFENDAMKKTESQLFEKNDFEPPQEDTEPFKPKKNFVNDLFDDIDDDDTLFTAKPISHKPPDESASAKNDSFKDKKPAASLGLVWDKDEGLFDSIDTEIDHDFFNSSGLFDVKVKKGSEPEVTSKPKDQDVKPQLENQKTERKETVDSNMSKMAAVKDYFEDPYGFSKESNYLKIGVLDSEEEDDLFSKTFKDEKKPVVKAVTLPEANDDADDDDIGLFAEKPKHSDSVSMSSSRSSLFDELSASKSRLASVFEKDKTAKVEDDLFNAVDDSLFGEGSKPAKDVFSSKGRDKEKVSLFDDCHDDDDLFGAVKNDAGGGKKPFKEDKQMVRGAKSSIGNLGDDDLFKVSEFGAKLRESKSDVTVQSEEKLFVDEFDDSDLFSDKSTPAKPKPPSSLSLKARESPPRGKPVGKLNIPDNLKFKFESAAKNISSAARPPAEEKTEQKEEEILNVSLQPSVLLKCPSKDRVKIPGRRRPQSRRARQEAIRNSGTWDQSPSGPSVASQRSKELASSPIASNPLSPSTDEEDFFKVPELDTNFEKEDQSIFKSDLFESSKSSKLDDNLLFDGAPVISPLGPTKSAEDLEGKGENPANLPETDSLFFPTTGIFDDEEKTDEMLFKTSKSATGDSALFNSPAKKGEKVKKPLFEPDLDDEEDDLFKGKSPMTPSKLPLVEKIKKTDEAKNRGNSSFVDPLGLITKDE